MSDLRPFDLEAVARDDELLDQLASGVRPETTDPVIGVLHTWRGELTAGVGAPPALSGNAFPGVRPARASGVAPVNGAPANGTPANGTPVNGVTRMNGAARTADLRRTNGAVTRNGREPEKRKAAGVRPAGRRRAAVAAVVVGLCGGLGGVAVAAADAQPGSPLWPITRVIYADSAADRQHEAEAKTALAKAREALADGRVSAADRYLDEAGRHAASSDSASADELRDEVAAVRDQLQEKESEEPEDTEEPGAPESSPSASTDPSGSGDDAPVTTPTLPTPTTGTDDAGTPAQDRGNRKDSREPKSGDNNGGKKRTEATSSELELQPGKITDIPRSLPEF